MRKIYARTVLCVYFEIFYFELLHHEMFINATQNIFYFELLDPEI